jgi:peptide/nickel transport system ATP-binding protein
MLRVEGLRKVYRGRGFFARPVVAVQGVSFSLARGESLAIIGESGSGKTTVARMVSRLLQPTTGIISFESANIAARPPAAFVQTPQRRLIQHVFQDPGESLTPHFTIFDAIADPLRRLAPEVDVRRRVHEVMAAVALPSEFATRYPHQLSGGQKARVGIARALAPSPHLLVLDEPTAALDVSVQAAILKLLDNLRAEFGLAFLFISHDIEVVRLMCERAILMQHGRVIEEGTTQTLLATPTSDYGRALTAAVPRLGKTP